MQSQTKTHLTVASKTKEMSMKNQVTRMVFFLTTGCLNRSIRVALLDLNMIRINIDKNFKLFTKG